MATAPLLYEMLPDPHALLRLEPPELGMYVLRVLADDAHSTLRSTQNFVCAPGTSAAYPAALRGEVRLAIAEAWAWLKREGLLVPSPEGGVGGTWVVLSRRGKALAASDNLRAYQQARLLPEASLHERLLAAGVQAAFLRGDYDTAAFSAFKAVEVAVREASGAPDERIGVALMREAFHADQGPLRQPSWPQAEREALAHLMAGAVGLFKNPQSHRVVGLADPGEAAEVILFASHLLRLVDRCAAASKSA